jgi:hypothetical protein
VEGNESLGWATGCFGDLAPVMRELIVKSFREAVSSAQDAQDASLSTKRFPYGSTLMIRRYEALVANLRDLPDAQVVKPTGAPYELVVVRGNLIFPFRYAEDDRTSIVDAQVGGGRISELVMKLFERFGAKPAYVQDSLLDVEEEAELRPILTHLPEGTRLILVAYAANSQAGLLKLYWGEATLGDRSGHVKWVHYEEIPLIGPDGSLRGLSKPDLADAGRFDQGEVPGLEITTRPVIERKNESVFPVSSEAEDETAPAAGHEQ